MDPKLLIALAPRVCLALDLFPLLNFFSLIQIKLYIRILPVQGTRICSIMVKNAVINICVVRYLSLPDDDSIHRRSFSPFLPGSTARLASRFRFRQVSHQMLDPAVYLVLNIHTYMRRLLF